MRLASAGEPTAMKRTRWSLPRDPREAPSMETWQFDRWTRRQFGRLAAGSAAALIGAAWFQEADGRKKRKKKRKTGPKQTCRALREECDFGPEESCCGRLVCNDNTCVGDPVCVQPEGGSCRDICDCQLGLQCSDRFGNTCRRCAPLQAGCNDHDDCCHARAVCSATTGVCCQQLGGACGLDSECCPNPGKCGLVFGGTEPVCCKGAGFTCEDHGDCCDPLRCHAGGTCQ